MRNISDYSGEEAIEICGEMLDPLCVILGDNGFRDFYHEKDENGKPKNNRLKIIQYLTKHHAKEVKHMLAILDGEDPETYQVSIITLPIKLMQLLNDPLISSLFPSQSQTTEETSSGSATENTEARGN